MNTDVYFPQGHIGLANHRAFAPGEVVSSSCVHSRMLLWCIGVRWNVRGNGVVYEFKADSFLMLPWAHSVHYTADAKDPFLLGGAHIIPKTVGEKNFKYGVLHVPWERPEDFQGRSDVSVPGLGDVVYGEMPAHSPLRNLAEYLVCWYQRGARERTMATLLANVLAAELLAHIRDPRKPLPANLRVMMDFAEARLVRPISVGQLAKAGGCSLSTMTRLFRRSLGMTPVEWLTRRRMERAAELLSTTRLRMGEVGVKVGVDDQYYFSKLFKRRHGVTAREYRRKSTLL